MHKSNMDKIRSKCIQFLWGKGDKKAIYFVKWDRITAPKHEGGLGLRNLLQVNNALLVKNIWRAATRCDALWIQVLKAKYHATTSLWLTRREIACSRLWQGMVCN